MPPLRIVQLPFAAQQRPRIGVQQAVPIIATQFHPQESRADQVVQRVVGVVENMAGLFGGIALAPQGTWPVGFEGGPPDAGWMRRYVGAARDPQGFRDMLASLETEAPWASRLAEPAGQPA